MKFITKLFNKKKKVDSEPISEPIQAIPEPILANNNYNRKVRKCKSCNQPILPEDKYTKQAGEYYHRQCWRNMVKEVKKVI